MAISLLDNAPRNMINRVLGTLCRLPHPLRLPLFNFLFGRFSRFYRTIGVKAQQIGPYCVTLALANRGHVRNHIRGIHAVALTLPAEYAAGLVVAQHLPANVIVVLKSLNIELHKAVHGSVRATATLTHEQGMSLRDQTKGEIKVAVSVDDETGRVPVVGHMCIAWMPPR